MPDVIKVVTSLRTSVFHQHIAMCTVVSNVSPDGTHVLLHIFSLQVHTLSVNDNFKDHI